MTYIPRDEHPPGYVPKLRIRRWLLEGELVKVQWQRNCFSNMNGEAHKGWKAIDTVLDSDVADTLMDYRGFTHDEADDVVVSTKGYDG